MDFSSLNWLAVLACVVFTMVSGSIWFGPKTLYPVWWKALGMGEKAPPKATPLTWILVVVTSLVQNVFLAFMVNAMSNMFAGSSLISGALTGFLVWVGFVATTGLVNKLFTAQYRAWMLEQGNHLINFVVCGAILGAWR